MRHGGLARIIGISILYNTINVSKQYFDLSNCGDDKCLEGDGGHSGAPIDFMYPVLKLPEWGWCNFCKEYTYFTNDNIIAIQKCMMKNK